MSDRSNARTGGFGIVGASAVVLIGASVAGPAGAVVRTWDGSVDNNWFSAFNWTPAGTPTTADNVTIGNAPNNAVVLGSALTGNVDTVNLVGGSGASLNTNGRQLQFAQGDFSGRITVGDGTSLIAVDTGSPGTPALFGDTLSILNGGSAVVNSESVLSRLAVASGGTFAGTGTVRPTRNPVAGVAQVVNDGTISVGFLGGGDLTLRTVADGTGQGIDLDGAFGNGIVRATADAFLGGVAAANLIIDGEVADAFGGTMEIARRDSITFNNNWELNGDLIFRGSDADPATLAGAFVEADDGADVRITQGTAVVNAPMDFVGGTFTAEAGTTLRVQRTVRFLDAGTPGGTAGRDGRLDISGTPTGDPVTLEIVGNGTPLSGAGSIFLGQPTIDLDGAAGENVIDVSNAASLWISGDTETSALDGFDGEVRVGTNSGFRVDGRITFDAGSVFAKSATDVRLFFNGAATINTAVDLDGIGSGDQLTDIHVGADRGYGGALLDINVALETTGNSDFGGRFLVGGTLDIDVPGAAAWELSSGGSLDLTVNGRQANFSGTLPAVGGRPTVRGDTIFLDGRLAGDGLLETNVNARNGSRIAPGAGVNFTGSAVRDVADGTGLLTWDNAGLTINAGATVAMKLGGPNRGEATNGHDAIDARGIAINGGILALNLISGYAPMLYNEHVLIQETVVVGSLGGVFDQVAGVELSGSLTGTALAVTYNDTQVLVQRALLGDANLNGQVEQADLNAVLSNWGSNNAASSAADVSWVLGDFNGDGRVAQADLNAVLSNWGSAAPPSFEGFAIPEPGAAAVVLFGVAGWRRR